MTLLYLTSSRRPAHLAAALERIAVHYGPLVHHCVSESPELCPAATVLIAELNSWEDIANSRWLARLQQPELTSALICHTVCEQDAIAAIDAGANSFSGVDTAIDRLALIVAIAHRQQQKAQQLQRQLQQFQKQLRDRITIEKAKGMLMQTKGCSENDAYQQLRRQAMQRQLPIIELARQLLSVGQLLQP